MSTSSKSRLHPRIETHAPEAPAPRESDPQEIGFLPRREGRPWSRERVLDRVRLAREAQEELESQGALRHWTLGDRLLELYNGFAERSEPGSSFETFATAHFDLRRAELYELLRIRHRATREEARQWGLTAMLLAFRIMDKLGLETFETLRQRDLPQPDGTRIRFPAPRRRLEAALALLNVAPEVTSPRSVLAETRNRNEALLLARQEDPRLEGVRARWYAGQKEPELRITSALGKDGREAIRDLIDTLDGRRRK